MGEGFDENNVSVIYNKNGIQSLSINGYYPLELKNEVEVVSPEMVLKALENILAILFPMIFMKYRGYLFVRKLCR